MGTVETYSGYDFSDADDSSQSSRKLQEAIGTREKPGTFFDPWGKEKRFHVDAEGHCIAVDIDEEKSSASVGRPAVRVTIYPPKDLEEAQEFVRDTANNLTPCPRSQEEFKLNPQGRDRVKVFIPRGIDDALAKKLLDKIAHALPNWV